jgi:uracil-DNA glycosylase family protein
MPEISGKGEARPSARRTLLALHAAASEAKSCHACDLWKHAMQTVFGEANTTQELPELMLIGEQPGDAEDRAGHPFVGPAGRVLDRGLAAAGIDRKKTYVTNAVKHFKWEPRGKRRLHKKPNREEVQACRRWLDREMQLLQPRLIVCLGATASQALLGSTFKVTVSRGRILEALGTHVMATVHPSSILRDDPGEREAAFQEFVKDLAVASDWLGRAH